MMDKVVTVRIIEQFDPRVDILRRMNYGAEPSKASMIDEFDDGRALYLVAYFEGEAVGSVRLSCGPRSPMHHWVMQCPLEDGAHVIDFNRAVVARAFRKNGLCRLMLAEVVIAAHRLGFRHAIAAIEDRSVLIDMFRSIGFANVGKITKAKHGSFEGYVQPLETPLTGVQSKAHVHFGKAIEQMQQAGYTVRSLVPTDIEAIIRRRTHQAAVREQTTPALTLGGALVRGADALGALAPALSKTPRAQALPFPKEPTRWQDHHLARHLVDSVAIILAITPIYAFIEWFLLGMSPGVVWSARLLMAAIVLAGLGTAISWTRDRSISFFSKRRNRSLTGAARRLHDLLFTLGVNGTLAPVVYFVAGAQWPQILGGALAAMAIGVVTGPFTGLMIDRIRALTGVEPTPPVRTRSATPTPTRGQPVRGDPMGSATLIG